jgi:preflagellin peptidase FlaK
MLLGILLFFSISLISLLVATYTDLKERIVSDKLIAAMIAAGLILHGYFAVTSGNFGTIIIAIAVAIATFAAAYLLWKLGMWAGGDVKLFTCLALLNPFNYGIIRDFVGLKGEIFSSSALPLFPLSLFIFSIFAMLPYGTALSIGKVLKNNAAKEKIIDKVKKGVVGIASLAGFIVGVAFFLKIAGLPALAGAVIVFAASFVLKKFYNVLGMAFALVAFVFDFNSASQEFVILFVSLLPLYAIIQLYFISRDDLFATRKKITELDEGEIAGENIVIEKGEVKRVEGLGLGMIINHIRNNRFDKIRQALERNGEVLASERSAGGLTTEQIKKLQGLVNEGRLEDGIKIKDSAPFVPAVLIAYVVLQLTGDLIWNLIL